MDEKEITNEIKIIEKNLNQKIELIINNANYIAKGNVPIPKEFFYENRSKFRKFI
jgi:hypothetical protein